VFLVRPCDNAQDWTRIAICRLSKAQFTGRSGNQDVLAFYERLGYAIVPSLTFYKRLIDEHQDKQ